MKLDIKNLFLRHKARSQRVNNINATRDWRIIIGVFFVINIAIMLSGTYLLYYIAKNDVQSGKEMVAEVDTFNKATLQEVVSVYKDKEYEFKNILSAGVDSLEAVDPSR